MIAKTKIYGCQYLIDGVNKVATFKAKSEDDARILMMKFAEKNNIYVQNIGAEK
jgi:hypothetical protein